MQTDENMNFTLDLDELDAMLDEQRSRMDHTLKLEIEHFTDPLCGWCYGMEPATTMLRFRLGERVDYHYTMGLMIPDAAQMVGTGLEAVRRFNAMKGQLAAGYSIMANKTGMPMSWAHVPGLQPDDIETVNSSLAYEAIKIVDGPDAASRFLKLLRQSAFAFDMQIGKQGNVDLLVESTGVDVAVFRDAIESGRAQYELDGEVARTRSLGIEAFPTLLITYGSMRTVVGGYQTPEDLAAIVADLTDGYVTLEAPEYSKERALDLLRQFDRVSAEEMRAAFDLTEEDLEISVGVLKNEGLVDVTPRGGSFFISLARS